MKIKYKIIFFIIFLFLVNNIKAQSRVSFNEYGVFLVKNGIIEKIDLSKLYFYPEISWTFFWENYLILETPGGGNACIFNMETKAMSDAIEEKRFVKLENGNNLIAYVRSFRRYWKYEYNYDTLELISEVELNEDQFSYSTRNSDFYDLNGANRQRTTEEKINDRLYRYRGTNYYLDIHYGANIDLTGAYEPIFVRGGRNNIFIVIIQKIPYDFYNR